MGEQVSEAEGSESKVTDTARSKSFVCTVCNRKFLHRYTLQLHMRVHSGDRPYVCKKCNMAFVWKSLLDRHLAVHTGNKPYKCRHCSKGFCQRTSLVHHERTHTGEKPFVCQVCSKSFAQKGHLKEHAKIHSGDRPYVCHFCKKGFSSRGNLNQHKKIHTGERPFVCGICFRSFTQKVHLKDHLNRHAGDGQFVCDICFQGFVTVASLQEHAKAHTEETLHYCETCGRHYSKEVYLKQHKRCRPPAALAESVSDLSPADSNNSVELESKNVIMPAAVEMPIVTQRRPTTMTASSNPTSPSHGVTNGITSSSTASSVSCIVDDIPLDLSSKTKLVNNPLDLSLTTQSPSASGHHSPVPQLVPPGFAPKQSIVPLQNGFVVRPMMTQPPVHNSALQRQPNLLPVRPQVPSQYTHVPVDTNPFTTSGGVVRMVSPGHFVSNHTVVNSRFPNAGRPPGNTPQNAMISCSPTSQGATYATLFPNYGTPRPMVSPSRSLPPGVRYPVPYQTMVIAPPSVVNPNVPSQHLRAEMPFVNNRPVLKQNTNPTAHNYAYVTVSSNSVVTQQIVPHPSPTSLANGFNQPSVRQPLSSLNISPKCMSSSQETNPTGSIINSIPCGLTHENRETVTRSVYCQTSPLHRDMMSEDEQSSVMTLKNRTFVLETELKCMREAMMRKEEECAQTMANLRKGVVQLMGMLDPELVMDMKKATGEEVDSKLSNLILSLKQMD